MQNIDFEFHTASEEFLNVGFIGIIQSENEENGN